MAEEDFNLDKETDDILLKIQEQMKLSEQLLSSIEKQPKTKTYRPHRSQCKDRQNLIKIEDSSLEFVNIDESFKKKPDSAPFNDFCSICSSPIYFQKYICIVCKDCALCPKCEVEHSHPVIKCKYSQLSNLNDIFIYLNKNNPDVKKYLASSSNGGFFGGLPKYEFKLECYNFEFSMKQNKVIEIPVSLINLNKNKIDGNELKLILFARNNKDLKINNKEINKIIDYKEECKTKIFVESGDVCKNYNFEIDLFSSSDKVKIICNPLSIKLSVNNDKEEEEINKDFIKYPNIVICSKEMKKNIRKIYQNPDIKQDPPTIWQHLQKSNGNVEEATKSLLSLNNPKENNK